MRNASRDWRPPPKERNAEIICGVGRLNAWSGLATRNPSTAVGESGASGRLARELAEEASPWQRENATLRSRNTGVCTAWTNGSDTASATRLRALRTQSLLDKRNAPNTTKFLTRNSVFYGGNRFIRPPRPVNYTVNQRVNFSLYYSKIS